MNSTFYNELQQYSWEEITTQIYQKTSNDVQRALAKNTQCNLDDFMALLSPAASDFLEEMAIKSHQITKKRFGNVIRMYLPLYLSNRCQNNCTYCGFRHDNHFVRKSLTSAEISTEVAAIKKFGYDHILLVSGEDPTNVGIDYFEKALELVRPYFVNIAMEVQPLDQENYIKLIQKGLNSVYVYQETYHEKRYPHYHPKGKKANFQYRLETPDRLGKAAIHKIGLGCLLGLEDWRVDSWFTGLHLTYLEKKYWKTNFSISCPRLRPAVSFNPNYIISDKDMVQLICAYRLLNENVELSLSTRESPVFRDHTLKLGITCMSAGSKTEPAGYTAPTAGELEQFTVNDSRSPQEVAAIIRQQGYEPVWKDWDPNFIG